MNTNSRPIPDTPLYRPSGRPLSPVPGPGTPGGRLDAGGARLRLRALHVMGHGSPRLARALGVRKTTIQELVGGRPAPSARTCATPSTTCTKPGGTGAPPNAPA